MVYKEITNAQQNSLWGQYVRCDKVDTILGVGVMGVFLYGVFHKLYVEVCSNTEWNAMSTALITMAVVGSLTHLVMVFLWFTLCFNLVSMHKFWKAQTEFSPFLMPGGFASRYGAFLLGIVLFITACSVSESIQPAWMLKLGFVWRPNPTCRATFVSQGSRDASFFRRFRRAPANGCFNVPEESTKDMKGYVLDWLDPASVEMGIPFNKTAGAFTSKHPPANLLHPKGEEAEGWCYYQCFQWTEIAFYDLVGSLGMIFAGAGVVVKITDSLSAAVGWKLVTESSSVVTLTHLRDVSSRFGWAPGALKGLAESLSDLTHKSRTVCAIELLLINLAARYAAKTFDVDGFNTVDYYVSVVIFQSVFFACILRFWSPFTNAPVIFTDKLWREGKDQFIDVDVDPPVYKEIDLYEWLHLTTKQRLFHCALYARRVGMDSIKSKPDLTVATFNVGKRKWIEKKDGFYKAYEGCAACLKKIFTCGGLLADEAKEEEDSMTVINLKPFDGVKEIIETDKDLNKLVRTEMIHVDISTRGEILNKTSDGKFVVKWFFKSGKEETLEIDPLFVAELTPEWSKFMKESELQSLRALLID